MKGVLSYCTRRHFLRFSLFLMPLVVCNLSSCLKSDSALMRTFNKDKKASTGRLVSRPGVPVTAGSRGLHPLKLDGKRDGFVYVPASYQSNKPMPLMVMLHGAGGDAEGALRIVQKVADSLGVIVLAPESRSSTWDVIVSRFGVDIAFIDAALKQVFTRYAIDPNSIAVGGFSDGASYALSVGITNGDLFTHVVAFSPGFMAPAAQVGEPQIFISHGTGDRVLPIDKCSRRLVPVLKEAGYDVVYQEFDGPHTVPVGVARDAVEWWLKPSQS